MDGEDVTRRGRELHGQMRGGDVNDKQADGNGFGLGSIAKHGVKVNVAAGGNLFA